MHKTLTNVSTSLADQVRIEDPAAGGDNKVLSSLELLYTSEQVRVLLDTNEIFGEAYRAIASCEMAVAEECLPFLHLASQVLILHDLDLSLLSSTLALRVTQRLGREAPEALLCHTVQAMLKQITASITSFFDLSNPKKQ